MFKSRYSDGSFSLLTDFTSFLNFKGCEEEGLYRVPGSGKEVKHWQRRFDSGWSPLSTRFNKLN